MDALKVHVLFRSSKKTGKVDTVITALGPAMLEWWAINNTTSSKGCLIVERDTGKVVYATLGTPDGFPKVRDARKKDLGTCEDYGLSIEEVRAIKDDRFDKEA